VTAPIVGANTPAQLAATMDALDLDLDDEHVTRLDDVSSFRRSRASLEQ
jgi:aryl-alcohol dehydrogenase-like predicted oxidoreductase